MFIKKNNVKSAWAVFDKNYSSYVYEDIFIRKYIFSFLRKFNKSKKVIGSIYILRTFGRLYIKVFYYNPIQKSKYKFTGRHSLVQKKTSKGVFSNSKHLFFWSKRAKPINKYKKQLIFLKVIYNLENLLKYQIYYKFVNIFASGCLSNRCDRKLRSFFQKKLRRFKHRNKASFISTIHFVKNLFCFRFPDGLLLANFVSFNLQTLYRHSSFIMYMQAILQLVCIVFKHVIGVKLVFSGKLNGFSRAQIKKIQIGRVPLQTIDIKSIYGFSEAFTKYGKLGIKVWIFLQDRS